MLKRVKPFTLFLCIGTIAFLLYGPVFIKSRIDSINPIKPLELEKEKWTGIINLWDIQTWDHGYGSRVRWLNQRIEEFEQQHPRVFIELRTMDASTAQLYLQGQRNDIQPDLLSFGPGAIPEIQASLLPLNDRINMEGIDPSLLKAVEHEGDTLAAPWMMGSYALLINKDAFLQKDMQLPSDGLWKLEDFFTAARTLTFEHTSAGKRKTEQAYGFTTYSNSHSFPLLSMILQGSGKIINTDAIETIWKMSENNLVPQSFYELSRTKALQSFSVDRESQMLLGSQNDIYRMRSLEGQGKAFEYAVSFIPGFSGSEDVCYTDQIQFMGVMRQPQKEKEKICAEFIEYLVNEQNQRKLVDIGSFSVLASLRDLYSEDEHMAVPEKTLAAAVLYVPDAFKWNQGRLQVGQILNDMAMGNKNRMNELEKLLADLLKR